MIEYITFRDFEGPTITRDHEEIKKGEKFRLLAGRIATMDDPARAICLADSAVAHQYFARNDDEHGLERGHITYEIAFADRKNLTNDGVYRFDEEQQEILLNNYQRFLRPDSETILFNREFFDADIDELKVMARELNIKSLKEVYDSCLLS